MHSDLLLIADCQGIQFFTFPIHGFLSFRFVSTSDMINWSFDMGIVFPDCYMSLNVNFRLNWLSAICFSLGYNKPVIWGFSLMMLFWNPFQFDMLFGRRLILTWIVRIAWSLDYKLPIDVWIRIRCFFISSLTKIFCYHLILYANQFITVTVSKYKLDSMKLSSIDLFKSPNLIDLIYLGHFCSSSGKVGTMDHFHI